MYRTLQLQLQARIEALLKERYEISLANLAVELPPKIEFGEMALPVAFELAKRLKKAPRAIAQELQAELAATPGVAAVEIAGAGYLNVKLDRAAMVKRMAADEHAVVGAGFGWWSIRASILIRLLMWGICGMRSLATALRGC